MSKLGARVARASIGSDYVKIEFPLSILVSTIKKFHSSLVVMLESVRLVILLECAAT
jgi:hypothetical protein